MRAVSVLATLMLVSLAGCINPEGPIDRTPDEMDDALVNADGSWNLTAYGVNGDPFWGDPDAAVQVIAYDAPACSNCHRYHDNILPQLRTDYMDTGKIGYHALQFTIGFGYDMDGGVAVECAFREGGEEAYEAALTQAFDNQWSSSELPDILRDVASTHALDEEALIACYDDRDTQSEVEADIAAGRDSGAGSNPGFAVLGPDGFVCHVRGSAGPEAAIESALSGGSSCT